MKKNKNIRKVVNASLAFFVSASHIVSAMEVTEQELIISEGKQAISGPLPLRDHDYYKAKLQKLEASTTRIHLEVDRILEEFRRNMAEYYRRTRGMEPTAITASDTGIQEGIEEKVGKKEELEKLHVDAEQHSKGLLGGTEQEKQLAERSGGLTPEAFKKQQNIFDSDLTDKELVEMKRQNLDVLSEEPELLAKKIKQGLKLGPTSTSGEIAEGLRLGGEATPTQIEASFKAKETLNGHKKRDSSLPDQLNLDEVNAWIYLRDQIKKDMSNFDIVSSAIKKYIPNIIVLRKKGISEPEWKQINPTPPTPLNKQLSKKSKGQKKKGQRGKKST